MLLRYLEKVSHCPYSSSDKVPNLSQHTPHCTTDGPWLIIDIGLIAEFCLTPKAGLQCLDVHICTILRARRIATARERPVERCTTWKIVHG